MGILARQHDHRIRAPPHFGKSLTYLLPFCEVRCSPYERCFRVPAHSLQSVHLLVATNCQGKMERGGSRLLRASILSDDYEDVASIRQD